MRGVCTHAALQTTLGCGVMMAGTLNCRIMVGVFD